MDAATLEQWLWDAACEIPGSLDAPKLLGYIVPLVSLKRLSDVFEDEIADLVENLRREVETWHDRCSRGPNFGYVQPSGHGGIA